MSFEIRLLCAPTRRPMDTERLEPLEQGLPHTFGRE
jgi:hypothetical protein